MTDLNKGKNNIIRDYSLALVVQLENLGILQVDFKCVLRSNYINQYFYF